ncbi:MAG TPA: PaaI family thioesterase [Bacteroidota bacterium]|nr:PaaI family thioesterase [Bacteroidota bacterium]
MENSRSSLAVQDFYPDDFAHCFGCGRLNPHGHQIKTRWEGDETVTRFTPQPFHIAVPGYVYGGLIASLMDCHGMATASAIAERNAGRAIGEGPAQRYVTASLKVDYLKPTPLGPELQVRGRAKEIGARKIIVEVSLHVAGEVTARGEIVAVPVPEGIMRK